MRRFHTILASHSTAHEILPSSHSGVGSGPAHALPAAPRLSVIVPLHNESATLPALLQRLEAALAELPFAEQEILCIDDGSHDATFAVLCRLRDRYPRLKAVRFTRNFGKEAAMTAGLRLCSGDVVVLMDGDLQHPPELIPDMVRAWQQGAAMVIAVRRSHDSDPWLRRQCTRAYYALFRQVSEVRLPEGAGDFRLFSRQVVDAINALPERTRFMKGITSWVGFRQAYVEFEPEKRGNGMSNWSFTRLLRYALDGLTSFSTLPLRVWSVLGLAMALLSMVYGGWLVLRTLLWGIDVPGYASIMVATLFLSGIQLISLGVIGEYLGRVYTEVKARPPYLVAETIGFDDTAE